MKIGLIDVDNIGKKAKFHAGVVQGGEQTMTKKANLLINIVAVVLIVIMVLAIKAQMERLEDAARQNAEMQVRIEELQVDVKALNAKSIEIKGYYVDLKKQPWWEFYRDNAGWIEEQEW